MIILLYFLNRASHGFPELGDQMGRGIGIGITVGSTVTHPDFVTQPKKVSAIRIILLCYQNKRIMTFYHIFCIFLLESFILILILVCLYLYLHLYLF